MKSNFYMDTTEQRQSHNGSFDDLPMGNPIFRRDYQSLEEWKKACINKAVENFEEQIGFHIDDDIPFTYSEMIDNEESCFVKFGYSESDWDENFQKDAILKMPAEDYSDLYGKI